MRQTIWTAAAVMCLVSGGAAAPAPSAVEGPAPSLAASGMVEGQTESAPITVTGCLRPETLNTVNSQDGPGYRLTEVTRADAASSTRRAKGNAPKAYVLDGVDAELKPHVGHKVEITGVPRTGRAATLTSGSKDAAPAVTAGGTKTVDNGAPRLKVSSLRMIAPACESK